MNSAEQIRIWCHGTWLQKARENDAIETITIDSRNIEKPEGSLFVALKTPLRDGHDFIADCWHKGVRNFLVSGDIDTAKYTGANFIKAGDTLKALQQVAAKHRGLFGLPVIGITGSNGKTMIKEWLYQLLSSQYSIVRSPKSYNSQVGVPLSVWQIGQEHRDLRSIRLSKLATVTGCEVILDVAIHARPVVT